VRNAYSNAYGCLYTYPDGNSSIIADAQRNTHGFTYTHGYTYRYLNAHAHANSNDVSLPGLRNEHGHWCDRARHYRHR